MPFKLEEELKMFGKKENCALCGVKVGAFTKIPLTDGCICSDCRGQCSQYLSHIQQRSIANIKEHIAVCEANRNELANFVATDEIGQIVVDSVHKIWYVNETRRKELRNPLILKYSQLMDYTVTEDENTVSKSGAGRAVAGGLLFGGIGLVAGGLSGRKTKEVINKMSITLMIDSEWIDSIEIPIITTETKKGSMFYNISKNLFDRITHVLDHILAENSKTSAIQDNISPAIQIKQYKDLLDCGAITQEEFEMKKKELLKM